MHENEKAVTGIGDPEAKKDNGAEIANSLESGIADLGLETGDPEPGMDADLKRRLGLWIGLTLFGLALVASTGSVAGKP